jgi:GNAT superfamily N-acetyltransferase
MASIRRLAMRVLIRRAREQDAAALSQLMHESRAYTGGYAVMLRGYEVTTEQIRRHLVFLAEDLVNIWGFYSLTLTGGVPELDLFFVRDKAQGRGLGAELFAHLKTQVAARGLSETRIVSHPPAEGFYLRMGAVRIGVTDPSPRVPWSRPILHVKVSAEKGNG